MTLLAISRRLDHHNLKHKKDIKLPGWLLEHPETAANPGVWGGGGRAPELVI